MLWQQKRGLFLVTVSGEEIGSGSSSGSCSSVPWCMGASRHGLLLPGEGSAEAKGGLARSAVQDRADKGRAVQTESRPCCTRQGMESCLEMG